MFGSIERSGFISAMNADADEREQYLILVHRQSVYGRCATRRRRNCQTEDRVFCNFHLARA